MVVASNGGWVQNASSPAGLNPSNSNQNNAQNNKMPAAKGILICRDNSHPFQERMLTLEQPMKIGRSVARARAALSNAIFDCKVLSRNHALLWYSSGKFYLQDTCSSNGTFINNQRLSPSGFESVPKEVCSGDIVQFGVDVVESTKKVTHGCIVATLKLFLPDGKEAKASLSTCVSSPAGNISLEDLHKLNQVMQEASRREKALYSKLGYLQQLVENTRKSANQSWQALITEDRLLSWVVTIENQLAIYSKNYTDDKMRNDLVKLQDEKAQYQNAAKEALQKILHEKLEVTQKLVQLEGRLNETEEECQSLHNVAKYNQTELEELSVKYTETQKKLQDTTDKLAESEEKLKNVLLTMAQEKRDLTRRISDQWKVEKTLRSRLRDSRLDSVNIYKQITALRNYTQTLQDMHLKLGESVDSKGREDPIEAINTILNKLNSIHVDNIDADEINFYFNKPELDKQTSSPDVDVKQLKSTDSLFTKDQLDESQMTSDNDSLVEYILPPPSLKSTTRKTLINGNVDHNLDGDTMADSVDSDTCSEATDDTCSTVMLSEETIEKSVIENMKESESMEQIFKRTSIPCKMEVRFASVENALQLETHYESAAESRIAKDDSATEVLTEEMIGAEEIALDASRVEATTEKCEKDRERVEDVPAVENVPSMESEESEDRTEGDYVKTLKPVIKNDAQHALHSREYILQMFINSLNSLENEDTLESQQIVKRELDELKDWLIRESNEVIIDKLKDLYYRAKNEAQRMQEVNEELVIVKEKYNAFVEEKAELSKKYTSLKAQCGDLLNTTYSVPIHYVAPIVIMLLWMLMEKIF